MTGCMADYDKDCKGKKPKGCMCFNCCLDKKNTKKGIGEVQMVTMGDLHGDGSNHIACVTCGFCKTCKDCRCNKKVKED